MSEAPDVGYVVPPGVLAVVWPVLVVGLGAVAVARDPGDPVARVAAAGSVATSLLLAAAWLRGWVEPRRRADGDRLSWRHYAVIGLSLFAFASLLQRHSMVTAAAAGFDAVGLGVLVFGRRRSRGWRRRQGRVS